MAETIWKRLIDCGESNNQGRKEKGTPEEVLQKHKRKRYFINRIINVRDVIKN